MHLMNLLGDRDPRVVALRRKMADPNYKEPPWWHWRAMPANGDVPRGEWLAISYREGAAYNVVRLSKTLGYMTRSVGGRREAEIFCLRMNARHAAHGKDCGHAPCCPPGKDRTNLNHMLHIAYYGSGDESQ